MNLNVLLKHIFNNLCFRFYVDLIKKKSYNLKDDLKEVPIFYGRGAWDEEKMSIKDRSLCKLLKMVISKKDSGTYEPWMKELLISSGKKCDWTNKEYLKPLLEFIK